MQVDELGMLHHMGAADVRQEGLHMLFANTPLSASLDQRRQRGRKLDKFEFVL